MKALLIISIALFLSGLLTSPALPLSYEIDVDQDGLFETGGSINLNVSDSVTIDIYLDGYFCSPHDELFGVQEYILVDEAKVTVSGFSYDDAHGGPFDYNISGFNRYERNVYMLIAIRYDSVTVTGGRQKLGTITLTCTWVGSFTLAVTNDLTSFGYPAYNDGFLANCNYPGNNSIEYPTDAHLTINGRCGTDGTPCDDGIYCNGAEACDSGICISTGGEPCLFCAAIGCVCDEENEYCIGCDADDDCDEICNVGASSPKCSGSDNCPSTPNVDQLDSYPLGGNGCGDACECHADCNGDQKVNLTDLTTMKAQFLWNCSEHSSCEADCNYDAKVNLGDLVMMKNEFSRTDCPACP